jgi:hypothetical protein
MEPPQKNVTHFFESIGAHLPLLSDPKPLLVLYDVSELSKPTWKQNPKKVEIINQGVEFNMNPKR